MTKPGNHIFVATIVSLIVFLLSSSLTAIAETVAARAPLISSITPSSTQAGEKVVIRGSRLGRRPGFVKFGKALATIRRWKPTRVVVTVPPGEGSLWLRLVKATGRRARIRFTYLSTPGSIASATVFSVNDLGMHCVDDDFSVFSILPPFNVLTAQVVGRNARGKLQVFGSDKVELSYSAVTDPAGSTNSTSIGKSNFWTYAPMEYGASLPPGEGLTGFYMPADAPDPSRVKFHWDDNLQMFSAAGVPIFPTDDNGHSNFYPLLRVSAFEKSTGKLLSSQDIVVPVSDETYCAACHSTGKAGAARVGPVWANDANENKEARLNVLILHDFINGTTLMADKPVLCASCHYSPALDLAGTGPSPTQQLHATMSAVMHSYHADKMKDNLGHDLFDSAVPRGGTIPAASKQACYTCHPGVSTLCLRGAMTSTLNCQNCHGKMSAVGGDFPLKNGGSLDGTNDGGHRRPWKDLPRCQSCHTGDAVDHKIPASSTQYAADLIRFLLAYAPTDPAASPFKVATSRFAEEPGKLFRHSKGHGGLACESCHGSTHAIWPNQDPNHNDNIASTELQGHAGTVAECSTCHGTEKIPLNLNGPHGLHPIGDPRWVSGHGSYVEGRLNSCRSCHGLNDRGTVLSKATAPRTFSIEDRISVKFNKGDQVGCYECHNGPGGDD